jgi:hypothetical protein
LCAWPFIAQGFPFIAQGFAFIAQGLAFMAQGFLAAQGLLSPAYAEVAANIATNPADAINFFRNIISPFQFEFDHNGHLNYAGIDLHTFRNNPEILKTPIT